MKKLFTLFILLSSTFMFAFGQSGQCGENLTWEYNSSTHVLTISGTGAMDNYSLNDLPWAEFSGEIAAVQILDGVTSICSYAFFNCASINSISIAASVKEIGNFAFSGCANLTHIYCYSQLPPSVQSMTFFGVPSANCTLHVPNESVTSYSNAAIWDGLSDNIVSIEENPEPTTALQSANADAALKPVKVIEEGRVYILMPDGRKFNVNGARVR